MAEVLFQQLVEIRGEEGEWLIESAGIAAFDGEPATNNTQIVASERGMDLSSHRSKRATRPAVEPFALLLVMEERHREVMREAYPDLADRVFLLREMVDAEGDVHDPIGTTLPNYRAMAEEVESVLNDGFDRIKQLAEEDSTPD